MTISAEIIDRLAARLDAAQDGRADTLSLDGDPEVRVRLDADAAYAVQGGVVERRLGRGERIVGVKLGFTSKEKMAQMGVSEVIVGRLTDAMAVADGGTARLGDYIHPKVEPEVAYRICADVDLDDDTVDILAHVDAVAPALEIIDSRYRDFKFTYTDVIADNTSAAGFVVGQWMPMREVPDNAVHLRSGDAEIVGTTAAILGDPTAALHALLDMCRRRRIDLRAGDVVLAGAATAALPLLDAAVTCDIEGLGRVSVTGVR